MKPTNKLRNGAPRSIDAARRKPVRDPLRDYYKIGLACDVWLRERGDVSEGELMYRKHGYGRKERE